MSGVLRSKVDHRFTMAHASEYLDGELPPAGRERVEHHASACPGCRSFLAALRRMLETLPSLATPPRPGVTEGVLERLRRDT